MKLAFLLPLVASLASASFASMFDISEACIGASAVLQGGNKEVIARALDAWGKPVGFLEGSFTSLGDYHECLNLNAVADVPMEYVMVVGFLDINIAKVSIQSELGICVPAACASQEDVQTILSLAIAQIPLPGNGNGRQEVDFLSSASGFLRAFAGVAAQSLDLNPLVYRVTSIHVPKASPWFAGDITYVVILCVIGFIVLTATFLDYVGKSNVFAAPAKSEEEEPLTLSDIDVEDRKNASVDSPKRRSVASKALQAFSLYETVPILFRGNSPNAPELNALNGFRVISIWWVLLGHVASVSFEKAPIDLLGQIARFKSLNFVVLINGFFSVDTFFFLGGFLLAYTLFKSQAIKKKFKYIQYLLFRYLRLTPSFAVGLFAWYLLYPHLGEGPVWYIKQDINRKNCSKWWWSHLLYLNDFLPDSMNSSCMSWSWYLATDFHLYMVAPAFLLLLDRVSSKKIKYGTIAFVFAACAAVTMSTNIVYDVPTIGSPVKYPDGHLEATRDRHERWLAIFYQKPYNHLTVYVIGIVAAYLTVNWKNDRAANKVRALTQPQILAMQLIGAALLLVTLYLPFTFLHNLSQWSKVSNAMYNYFSRIGWALGLALFLFPSIVQPADTHLLTKIWSWDGWAIMARLTYGVYLIHLIIIQIILGQRMREAPMTTIDLASLYGSILWWSYIASGLLFVTVEQPMASLVKLFFR
eukprot:Partr_v1_DN28997_c0_g1_i2_m25564 putative nose resistant to fluoxetine protein 6-like